MTPEEQLLRLIESGGRAEPGKEAGGGFVFWDPRTWAGLLSSHGEKAKGFRLIRFAAGLRPREFDLKLVNRSLIVLLVFLLAWIVFNMNRVRTSVRDLPGQVSASASPAGEPQVLASLKPMADYQKDFKKRDLFSPVVPLGAKKPEPGAKKPKPEAKKPEKKPPPPTSIQILEQKAKNLKLVGISWGKDPIAMIEDTANRETFFVKAGQSVNDIQVKAIMKDRAVLGLRDAEYELF